MDSTVGVFGEHSGRGEVADRDVEHEPAPAAEVGKVCDVVDGVDAATRAQQQAVERVRAQSTHGEPSGAGARLRHDRRPHRREL